MEVDQDDSAWTRTVDVAVVGFGAAGAIAAIEAADAGATVEVLEKMPFPGGLSAVSAGGLRYTTDADAAFTYLQSTCGGKTPDDVLRVLADGMLGLPDYLDGLAAACGATVKRISAVGNYPFPGYETLGFCQVDEVPSLTGATAWHAVEGPRDGAKLLAILETNMASRRIATRFGTAARRLIRDGSGRVLGLVAERGGETVRIRARGGVVLACGGFENNPAMQAQYFETGPVVPGSFLGNTGDGILMAQEVGADLWHMWHYHGPYGMRHPDPEYRLGFFMKALPMWTPGRDDAVSNLGVTDAEGQPSQQRAVVEIPWILVDQDGRRFMDEYPPYMSDTGVRPFDTFDPVKQRYPRLPAFALLDEPGRKRIPIGRAVANDLDHRYRWSGDNSAEIELGILKQASTIAALAERIGVPAAALERTVAAWNDACARGEDDAFGRRDDTMVPIVTPPFLAAEVWPMVINTQGGPVHDSRQRVLNPFGEPILGLYAAGELGSVFGHIYLAGGNLAECVVGGRIAGREAARLADH
ncbi:MAG: fumarate reductase [Rhizobiales bacterium NRL2]|nr:MAG: fumarate reductase [Rhizobiales bacterium NRL2]